MFKDIVVGVTPSGLDECAVEAAIGFAQRFEAKLYMVHVAGMGHSWGDMRHLEPSGETEQIKERILEHYAEKLKGVEQLQVHVVPGIPHAEVLRLARKVNSDLIIMGPHTREYAEKRSSMWGMAGSTLERVSQKARCPVMIVTQSTPYGEHRFENILVATDFSEQAECAVNYGGQLVRQYKAAMTLLHVVDMDGLAGQMNDEELKRLLTQNRERMEEEYAARLKGVDPCSFECVAGKPAMDILKTARLIKADLILMAHHSKEIDPEKAFLGSTVTQVALNAGCPTMSVNRHFDLRCGLMYDQDGSVSEEKAGASA
ncbi:MAG: universal stress protein [Desulfovibrio sp.]|jgi:nucleotide-binding universal stress UspA family protein